MSAVGIVQPIHQPDFAAEVSLGDPAELKLVGSADAGTATELARLVSEIHSAMSDRGIREVIVDLRTLEFMSAGSFNALVTWLGLVNELPPEQRYRMRFRSSSNIMWQRRSLRTLSYFATDIIVIEN